MSQFVHPAKEDITLTGVLAALADPVRLDILRSLMKAEGCMSCSEAAPTPDIAKSTLSGHFRMLREAGLIRTTKRGVEHRNVIRQDDINELFPGLLPLIIKLSSKPIPKATA